MANQARDYSIERQVKDSLAEHWASRLSGPQRLVAVDRPVVTPNWHLVYYTQGISRFQEIRDQFKEPVLRYQSVGQDLLALPPYIKFTPSDTGFGFIGQGFQIAASGLFTTSSAPTAHPEDNFVRAIALRDYWTAHAHGNDDHSQ
jgi:hypothetical protein